MGFPCSGRFPCHACHRHYPGGTDRAHSLSVPGRLRPSPSVRRVGSHIRLFEACSTFTRVTACMRAASPYATLFHRSVSAKVVTSSPRSDCFRLERPFAGWDSHPLETAVFARHTNAFGVCGTPSTHVIETAWNLQDELLVEPFSRPRVSRFPTFMTRTPLK